MTDFELTEHLRRIEKQNNRYRQGATLALLLIAVLAFMGQSGCQSEQPKQTAAAAPPPVIVQPYQRFVRIEGGLIWALDTKTGQLCRTWDWTNASIKNALTKFDFSKLRGTDAAAVSTQTCQQLWKAFPDEAPLTTKRDPLGLLGPKGLRKSK